MYSWKGAGSAHYILRQKSYNKIVNEVEKLLKEYLDYLEIEKNRSVKTRENYEH